MGLKGGSWLRRLKQLALGGQPVIEGAAVLEALRNE